MAGLDSSSPETLPSGFSAHPEEGQSPQERVEQVKEILNRDFTTTDPRTYIGEVLNSTAFWNNLAAAIKGSLEQGADTETPFTTTPVPEWGGRTLGQLRKDILAIISASNLDKDELLRRVATSGYGFDDDMGGSAKTEEDFLQIDNAKLHFKRDQIFPIWEKLVLEYHYLSNRF